jgi:uncharacterized coiled-coil DUF342 family protein
MATTIHDLPRELRKITERREAEVTKQNDEIRLQLYAFRVNNEEFHPESIEYFSQFSQPDQAALQVLSAYDVARKAADIAAEAEASDAAAAHQRSELKSLTEELTELGRVTARAEHAAGNAPSGTQMLAIADARHAENRVRIQIEHFRREWQATLNRVAKLREELDSMTVEIDPDSSLSFPQNFALPTSKRREPMRKIAEKIAAEVLQKKADELAAKIKIDTAKITELEAESSELGRKIDSCYADIETAAAAGNRAAPSFDLALRTKQKALNESIVAMRRDRDMMQGSYLKMCERLHGR